jgi:integrase
VFPSASGKKHFNSFSQGKAAFDELLPDDMEPWTLHDLRRTSRSLMSRVGVTTEIAERVLGHKRKGVERVYDRFAYTEEKSAALQKLADCIALILNPPEKENVVQLKPR